MASQDVEINRVGHVCKLTWVINNFSQLCRPDRRVLKRINLARHCRVPWNVYAQTDNNGQLLVGFSGTGNPRVFVAEGSHFWVANKKGDVYGAVASDPADPDLKERLEIPVEMSGSLDHNYIVSNSGFEVIDDILVVNGDIVVEDCCVLKQST